MELSLVYDVIHKFENDISPIKHIHRMISLSEKYNVSLTSILNSFTEPNIKAFIRMCLFEKSMDVEFIPETSGKCDLNSYRVKEYIEECFTVDYELGNLVSEVLQETIYVSYDKLVSKINNSIDKFILSIGTNPYIIVSDFKSESVKHYGSEQWIIQLLWNKMRNTNIKGIYHYMDKFIYKTVAWIDDCLYTGGNASEIFSRLSKIDSFNVSYISNAYVILGYASYHINRIVSEFPDIKFHFYIGENIPLYTEINPNNSIVHEDYFFSHDSKPMIYFDHKIAMMDSTFEHIYLGIVPGQKLTEEEKTGDRLVHIYKDIGVLPNVKPSRNIILVLEQYHNSM